MKDLMRYFWPATSLALACVLYATVDGTRDLRDHVALQRKVIQAQDLVLEQVMRVNASIEGQFINLMQRLGLDANGLPLVTTALWRSSMKGMRVSVARRTLQARATEDMDNPPIGGPAGDE